MISVDKAISLVKSNISVSKIVRVSTLKALGLKLAEDVLSPIDMPPFPQSAMDGYAVNYTSKIVNYKLIGEIQAGSSEQYTLAVGEAVRIFTGAAVPVTANRVVRQEDVVVAENKISFKVPKPYANIRPQGEQIRNGEVALNKGALLNPAAIGFLGSLGITEVKVYAKPKIAIITTGNELVKGGDKLEYGQIYESNSLMLEAVLNHFNFTEITLHEIPDDYDTTVETLKRALKSADVVILSGGISVGDYDFVGKALQHLEVKEIFYKVNQKPGKPLYFGLDQKTAVFALPGNPAAALTSFYIYILPSLRKMTGNGFVQLNKKQLPLTHDYKKKSGRTEILKSLVTNNSVKILEGQSSAMLRSFAEANALTILSSTVDSVKTGETVDVMLIE